MGGSRLLSLHRTVIRICAAPGAGGLVNPVAFECIRTAVGDDAGLLLGQMLAKVVLSIILVPPLIYLFVGLGRRLDSQGNA